MRDRFLQLYKEVFDVDGNIKACGRDTCKKLIEAANIIDNRVNYGSVNSGFMNVDELHALYKHESKRLY